MQRNRLSINSLPFVEYQTSLISSRNLDDMKYLIYLPAFIWTEFEFCFLYSLFRKSLSPSRRKCPKKPQKTQRCYRCWIISSFFTQWGYQLIIIIIIIMSEYLYRIKVPVLCKYIQVKKLLSTLVLRTALN